MAKREGDLTTPPALRTFFELAVESNELAIKNCACGGEVLLFHVLVKNIDIIMFLCSLLNNIIIAFDNLLYKNTNILRVVVCLYLSLI